MNILIRAVAASALAIVATVCIGATTSEPLSITVTNSLFASSEPVVFVLDGKVSCKVVTDKADSSKSCVFTSDCSKYTEQDCTKAIIKRGRHFVKADFGSYSVTRMISVGVDSAPGAPSKKVSVCVASESNGISRYYFECQ